MIHKCFMRLEMAFQINFDFSVFLGNSIWNWQCMNFLDANPLVSPECIYRVTVLMTKTEYSDSS